MIIRDHALHQNGSCTKTQSTNCDMDNALYTAQNFDMDNALYTAQNFDMDNALYTAQNFDMDNALYTAQNMIPWLAELSRC
jgi:vancomycin permeability regulator SanA